MNSKGKIKYIAIIIIILLVVFLSQKAYAWKSENSFISDITGNATNQASSIMAKGSDWVMSKVYPKVTEQVQKRGEIIKTEVNKEKQKVSENISEKISDYFSGVANSVVHPGTPQNCQPATSTN